MRRLAGEGVLKSSAWAHSVGAAPTSRDNWTWSKGEVTGAHHKTTWWQTHHVAVRLCGWKSGHCVVPTLPPTAKSVIACSGWFWRLPRVNRMLCND